MKIKSNVKAGIGSATGGAGAGKSIGVPGNNHNQTVSRGLKVKTNVKAGGVGLNHNQTAARGLKVKSGVKAGLIIVV
jgi:hypothetical protein